MPELAPAADEAVVHKTSADSFLDIGLDKPLKVLGRSAASVRTTGRPRPAVKRSAPEDEQGRGIHLVQAIAAAWGSRRESRS